MSDRVGVLIALGLMLGLVLQVGSAMGAATATLPLRWTEADLRLAPASGGSVRVGLNRGISVCEPGQPDLPFAVILVPLPGFDLSVGTWSWDPEPALTLRSDVIPEPVGLDRPWESGGPMPSTPDRAIYGGGLEWPRDAVRFRGLQSQQGEPAAVFLVCPYRWNPVTRELSWTPSGSLTVHFEAGADPGRFVRPLRSASSLSAGTGEAGAKAAAGQGSTVLSLGGGVMPSLRPSLDSVPVELVVICPESFSSAFQDLIDWKNRSGTMSAIRTTEWIAQTYPHGLDQAERIRLFLQEAYQIWGTHTVILGGDPSLVPIRYARSYSYALPSGVSICTDYYYACLDGNWNADGDNIWGEARVATTSPESDLVDLVPELRVGRVSASTADQVRIWVRKYLKYVQDPLTTTGYLDNILALGEVLFDANWQIGNPDSCQNAPHPCASADGAADCFAMIDSVRASPFGSFFQFDELYEREYWWNPRRPTNSRQLNRNNTLGSMNAGRNLVFHMGHGDRDRWAIGTGRLLNSDLLGTNSGERYSGLAYVVNCNSAAVNADCVGEAWQFAPNGGGLNYIGSSNLDFPGSARPFQDMFFHTWMKDPWTTPGDAWFAVTDSFGFRVGSDESAARFLLYSIIFLGDPDLPVWKSIPGSMQVSAPNNIQLGGAPVHIVATYQSAVPLVGARVCLYKAGDAMAVGTTGADGSVDLSFRATQTGPCQLTVTHPMAKPYSRTVTLTTAPQSCLVLNDYTIVDNGSGGTQGNSNGRIEAGETVALNLSYSNRGSAPAQGITIRLRENGSSPGFLLAVEDSARVVGDVAVGGSGTTSNAFRLRVTSAPNPAAGLATRTVLPLVVVFEAGDGTRVQEISPEANRPDLVLYRTIVRELDLPPGTEPDSFPGTGETVGLTMQIYNRCGGDFNHLRGRIELTNPGSGTIQDASAVFPPIPAGSTATSDTTIRFYVSNGQNFRVNFFLEDTLDGSVAPIWNRTLLLRSRPTVPESLRTQGSPGSIAVWWRKPPNTGHLWGYHLYHSSTETGPFIPAGPGFLENVRVFNDEGLPDMTRYWYRIAAVDSSGIEGRPTRVVVGSTSPGSVIGWPATMQQSADACPTVENLDATGRNEVICLSNALYAFTSLGDDYYDGDGIPSTRGILVPIEIAQNFYGKCAITDLLGDKRLEIIAVASNGQNGQWNPPAQLCVFDQLGRLQWSQTLAQRPVPSAPAIGDVDGDGSPDIVFLAGKWVWAFHSDGTPVKPGSGGQLLLVPGAEQTPPKVDWQYASVALANFDADAANEIVFTANSTDEAYSKLYVINAVETINEEDHYATNLGGFPYTYSDAGQIGQQSSHGSPAVGDVTSRQNNLPDGKPDIVIATTTRLWVFDPWPNAGDKMVWNRPLFTQGTEGPLTSSPALGYIDGDDHLDIAVGGGNGQLYVLDGKGNPLPGFSESGSKPYREIGPTGSRLGSPIIADLDGEIDGGSGHRLPEVIIGDNLGTVYAFRHNGAGMNGFPYSVPGGRIGVGLVAVDVDKDGHQNLVIQSDKIQEVTVLDFPACPFDPDDLEFERSFPWTQFRHDPKNTGFIDTRPIVTPIQTFTLGCEVGGDGQVVLSWRVEASVASFVVRRMLLPDGEWETVAEWPASAVQDVPGSYRTTDTPPGPGEWRYRIEAVDFSGRTALAGEGTVLVGAPLAFRLLPAQPNPFNPHTQIRLDLPRAGACDLRVVDVSGRTVRLLHSGPATAGRLELIWDGTDDRSKPVGSGIYFLMAAAEGQGRASQKLVLLK